MKLKLKGTIQEIKRHFGIPDQAIVSIHLSGGQEKAYGNLRLEIQDNVADNLRFGSVIAVSVTDEEGS